MGAPQTRTNLHPPCSTLDCLQGEWRLLSPATGALSANNRPVLSVSALDPETTLAIYLDPQCSSPLWAGEAAELEDAGLVLPDDGSSDGDIRFYARVHSPSGTAADCVDLDLGYRLDTIPPAAQEALSTAPPSPAKDAMPVVFGTSEPRALVTLFSDDHCQVVLETTTADDLGAFSFTPSVDAGSTTRFRVRAQDAAGNASECSTSSVEYRRWPAPTVFVSVNYVVVDDGGTLHSKPAVVELRLDTLSPLHLARTIIPYLPLTLDGASAVVGNLYFDGSTLSVLGGKGSGCWRCLPVSFWRDHAVDPTEPFGAISLLDDTDTLASAYHMTGFGNRLFFSGSGPAPHGTGYWTYENGMAQHVTLTGPESRRGVPGCWGSHAEVLAI